ncbi:hypothetical protein [Altericroceibacterium endophyticum]|nr:hypothetical protein [Altericroceibacterium endophyticum]
MQAESAMHIISAKSAGVRLQTRKMRAQKCWNWFILIPVVKTVIPSASPP